MARYIDLHAGEAALVPLAQQLLEDHRRVGDALPEQVVDESGVAGEHGGLGPPAAVAVGERPEAEAVPLDGPRLRPRQPRPLAEVGEVARLRVEALARLGRHLLQCLVYNHL